MRILVSGASGLVGKALVPRLKSAGHEVRPLSRKSDDDTAIGWNVSTGALDQDSLQKWGAPEAVIHLAGENIAASRWSAEQKRKIRESRVEATQKLSAELAKLRPRLFIGASAIGFYGNRGEEVLTEQSPGGSGFLANICEAWERSTERLVLAGVKVAFLRFGMILSPEGGALVKMLPIFRAGLGGKLGSGKQWMSWITLEDAVRIVEFCLENKKMTGAYNAVAPNPVRNSEFTSALGSALKRPTIFPAPAFGLRMLYGEMADELLLSSQRVLPERLEQAGFEWHYPVLATALRAVLYKN